MIATVEAILDTPAGDPAAQDEIRRIAGKQLRLIVFGIPHWRSSGGPRERERPLGLRQRPGEVPEWLNGRDWKSRNGGQPRSGVRIPPSPL